MTARILACVAVTGLALPVAHGGTGAPGAGDTIAVGVNRHGWSEIWLMNASGAGRTRLTEKEPRGTDASGNSGPAWSPDGRWIAFSGQLGQEEDDQLTELYAMRADGSKRRRLTTNHVSDAGPSWSPDGKRLAFMRSVQTDRRFGAWVMTMAAGGGSEQKLTHPGPGRYDLAPAWSPDGRWIAYTRVTSGSEPSRVLYAIRARGGGVRKLSSDGMWPDWSPDGTRVAFSSSRDGNGRTCFDDCHTNSEIYVLDVATGEERRLTVDAGEDISPAWSPDGASIAFVSDRSNPQAHEHELYVMAADGTDVRRLTRNDVWEGHPAWKPRG